MGGHVNYAFLWMSLDLARYRVFVCFHEVRVELVVIPTSQAQLNLYMPS